MVTVPILSPTPASDTLWMSTVSCWATATPTATLIIIAAPPSTWKRLFMRFSVRLDAITVVATVQTGNDGGSAQFLAAHARSSRSRNCWRVKDSITSSEPWGCFLVYPVTNEVRAHAKVVDAFGRGGNAGASRNCGREG